jgi:hypothetical protein
MPRGHAPTFDREDRLEPSWRKWQAWAELGERLETLGKVCGKAVTMVFDLTDKFVWGAGQHGMVGGAIMRRLRRESCQLLLDPGRTAVDFRRQSEVEEWMASHRPRPRSVHRVKTVTCRNARNTMIPTKNDKSAISTHPSRANVCGGRVSNGSVASMTRRRGLAAARSSKRSAQEHAKGSNTAKARLPECASIRPPGGNRRLKVRGAAYVMIAGLILRVLLPGPCAPGSS